MRDNMEDLKDKSVLDGAGTTRINSVPTSLSEQHAKNIIEENKTNDSSSGGEDYSLNDDRRVKVLSPGALVAKRFFRNKLAVTGLAVLLIMFIFAFLGGAVSPYAEDDIFYREDIMNKTYAGAKENAEFRYITFDSNEFSALVQAYAGVAIKGGQQTFKSGGKTYTLTNEGEDLYSISYEGNVIGAAYKDIIAPATQGSNFTPEFSFAALKAYVNSEDSFTADGVDYNVDENGIVTQNGTETAYISRYIVSPIATDIVLSKEFRGELIEQLNNAEFTDVIEFNITENGEEKVFNISYDAQKEMWDIRHEVATTVISTYESPSAEHWLGTDRNGMDMLTRLMYGGRVSLVIGFVVVFIETILGIIMGGISGYFGGWVDNIIMRIVDVFYCVPSTPILIIIGAAMDGMNVDPQIRMLYLMLILGFLGWPGVARMVRGQILSLREQEFMTATEACGIRVSRRIFRHLIPNVIPQLIVICTMGLGSTIITEATLSFLGLGVRFPFASWGNIINDVNSTYVLTTYLFVWIPAGVCLLLTVLAFNLVGDGLRDAFDPRMKR